MSKVYHDFPPDRAAHEIGAQTGILDLSLLPVEVSIADIDTFPNEAYALMRKRGLGGSDSSIILGVNPYNTREELIKEKCRTTLTEEEKAVGDKEAVVKGRTLEPVVLDFVGDLFNRRVFKPVDMYKFKDFPWLAMNFDGIIDKVYINEKEYQYIPCEVKIITKKGERHYNYSKAWYTDMYGFNMIPPNYSEGNNNIASMAAQYGIPPYYYTQLQQEMMATAAPFGYLAVLFEARREYAIYFIWADPEMHSALLVQSLNVWKQIQALRKPNFEELLEANIRNAIDQKSTDTEATLVGVVASEGTSRNEPESNTEHVIPGNTIEDPQ